MQTGMAQMFCDHFLVYMATPKFQTQYEQSLEPNQIELLYRDIYKAFAEEHDQLFKQSYMRSGYGETAGIHEFKWSLNSPLLDKCMAVPELPITLEKCGGRRWQNRKFLLREEAAALVDSLAQLNDPINEPGKRLLTTLNQHNGDLQFNLHSHMARNCPNPRQQQMRLMSAWNTGTEEERNKLWRMMGGGREQVGGGVAHVEEVPTPVPATIAVVTQPQTSVYSPPGFRFGQ
ncbi:hypothetical protein AMATHDRAFT_8841 [Amanita thiersii Skay4041]|uniref:Uncharacterized protein n=1 Tax=Amanita thiersii Skay4041 TaxID=703135 RepID=A0A2A9ND67_9AGAR|nr:hypothetical protein AMATHDRAFT_8841 [Amanita thiersii Skay4041]